MRAVPRPLSYLVGIGVVLTVTACSAPAMQGHVATGTADTGIADPSSLVALSTPAPSVSPPGSASGAAPSSSAVSSATASTTSSAPPAVVVTGTPAIGSTAISPTVPITITAGAGTLSAVELTNATTGYQVKGNMATDHKSWTTSEVLGYGKTYTLSGTATGTDGSTQKLTGSYTVLTPRTQVRSTIYPTDGMTVGVAMPIMVKFDTEPQDKALIEKNVSVTTTPHVEGAWGWIEHDGGVWGLDFRPEGYWPENTQVHVEAHLYGLKFADGSYGKTDITSDYTVGRNQVVKADVNSYQIIVEQDGTKVASYPASFGQGNGNPDLTTRSGIHVVNDMFPEKLMSNPKYHYTNVLERWAVRISNNGEFIHANPKSVGAQGNSNVTHGCINLSLENAEAYYKTAMLGDPVEITGTDVDLGPSDGDIFDYAVPWSTWLTLSALN